MGVKHRCFLLVGAPGSGKGTQGKVLGSIPGFCHVACGEVFRSLDFRSEVAMVFIDYSRRGELVPDEITLRLWSEHIDKLVALGRYKPEIDHLVLDGLPRNLSQAKLLEDTLFVRKVFHLSSTNRKELINRLLRRALKENRLDDASEEIIENRLDAYEKETAPILKYYGSKRVVKINATRYPYQVLGDILSHIEDLGTEEED